LRGVGQARWRLGSGRAVRGREREGRWREWPLNDILDPGLRVAQRGLSVEQRMAGVEQRTAGGDVFKSIRVAPLDPACHQVCV
jgi:hypothetical protein